MKHRLFIAINLPEEVKKELEKYQDKWPELPVRWVRGHNLHITLVFIGYADNQGILEVCRVIKEVAQKHQEFSINLNKICYGPPNHPPCGNICFHKGDTEGQKGQKRQGGQKAPRMIWTMGEATEEFVSLKNDLEQTLSGSNQIRFSSENRKPTLHITLGRIRQWDFRRIEPEERPEVDEEINLNFPVETIELMESKLKKTGPEYAVLAHIPLGEV